MPFFIGTFPTFRRRVFRVGLATNDGVDGKDLKWGLIGPKNRQQLQENLHHLRQKGPLSEEEMHWIREFGQVAHKASSGFTFRFKLTAAT
jgi:hypothetical protein